jgi:hypothetical protein
MLASVRDLFASRRISAIAVLIAIALALPTLRMGPMLDDFLMRYMLDGNNFPGGSRGRWDLYHFADGGAGTARAIDQGLYPWWASHDLRLAFFRPLSSLWLWLDHTLFGDAYWVVHAESIALYAALVLLVSRIYGRVLGGAAAGVATLLYAVDDAHALPVQWMSNRHALLSSVLSILALHLHARRSPAWTSVLAFAASLAAGENAVAGAGYLVAWALFMDGGGLRGRLVALAPHAAVAGLWVVVYVAFESGVRGSSGYVDPAANPAAFAVAAAERAPQLLLAQLLGPPSEVWALIPPALRAVLVGAGIVGATALVALVLRATRGHPAQRFLAAGSLLSIIPSCATFPTDRMLLLPGIGAFGLVAIAVTRVGRAMLAGRGSRLGAALAGGAMLVHLALAAPLFVGRSLQTDRVFFGSVRRGAESLPSDPGIAGKTLVVLSTPDPLLTSYMSLDRIVSGVPVPDRMRILTVAQKGRLTIERADAQSLVIRCDQGMLSDLFSRIYRDRPLVAGQPHRAGPLEATVLEADVRRNPTAIRYFFADGIDERYRWVVWKGRAFEEVGLPAPGERLEIEATDWMAAFGD